MAARCLSGLWKNDTARSSSDIAKLDQESLGRETLGRIKSDYRETLAQLHLNYLRTWVKWSHDHGYIVRNQSHGAPGNLLDLYANADIAETEIFGSTPFPIPGLRRDAADIANNNQDLPESLVVRLASSASHVAGHPLASSETATWLRDHWKESLAFVKPELDRIFADGINHIFYHGAVYSPQDAPWPGWLFYAATQFNPNNPWWDDFSALNHYVARVQSILQRGQPDNDILLYWPFDDLLDDEAGTVKTFTVHHVKWLPDQPVGKIARALMAKGYTFDYISDAQLQQTRSAAGALLTGGNTRYRVLVVPATRRMPVATAQKLAALADAGVLPDEAPAVAEAFGIRTTSSTPALIPWAIGLDLGGVPRGEALRQAGKVARARAARRDGEARAFGRIVVALVIAGVAVLAYALVLFLPAIDFFKAIAEASVSR
jgi:hypothetical protein